MDIFLGLQIANYVIGLVKPVINKTLQGKKGSNCVISKHSVIPSSRIYSFHWYSFSSIKCKLHCIHHILCECTCRLAGISQWQKKTCKTNRGFCGFSPLFCISARRTNGIGRMTRVLGSNINICHKHIDSRKNQEMFGMYLTAH